MKLLVTVSIIMLSIGMSAQPQGDRPSPPKQRTPEEIAEKEATRMKSEINLTDKQYKKVYKLIKKDQKYRQSQAEKQFAGGMPPQGGGMGGPGMGSGPGGMGGGMMGGGPGGMGGGMMGGGPGGMGGMGGPGGGSMGGSRPPQGDMGQGPRPEGGQMGMGPREDFVTEEYLEKQERKLKKILTAEQYSKWRSKHPAEHLELPPMEFEKTK